MRLLAAAGGLLALAGVALALAQSSGVAPVQEKARYVVRACFGSDPGGVTFRLAFYDAQDSVLVSQQSSGASEGGGCYRSQPAAYAPCGSVTARYSVSAGSGATPSSLALVEEAPPDGSCSAPTPTPTPTPTPLSLIHISEPTRPY